MKDRVLALGGLLQSLRIVRQIATTGQAETQPLEVVVESLFRFDAESTEAVYGNARQLWPGLRALAEQLDGSHGRDAALLALVRGVLQVERSFMRTPAAQRAVTEGLSDIARQREHFGPTHPTVLGRLGELYASSISPLRPRVLVQGNPAYLGEPTVVAEIRAVLLASLRSAVLWRQVGGSYWDFLLRRRAMIQAARELLR